MASSKKAAGAAEQKTKLKRAKGDKSVEILDGTIPEYASTKMIAQLIGKTTRRVQQLTQDGVLQTEQPPGGGARRYRLAETIQTYISFIEQKAADSGDNSRAAELVLKKLEAEVELKESQGQLHRLKTAIAEGRYLPAEQATEQLTDFMSVFKKFALNIPPRMAGSLSGYADAVTIRALEKNLRKELETMLETFADAAIESAEGAE